MNSSDSGFSNPYNTFMGKLKDSVSRAFFFSQHSQWRGVSLICGPSVQRLEITKHIPASNRDSGEIRRAAKTGLKPILFNSTHVSIFGFYILRVPPGQTDGVKCTVDFSGPGPGTVFPIWLEARWTPTVQCPGAGRWSPMVHSAMAEYSSKTSEEKWAIWAENSRNIRN